MPRCQSITPKDDRLSSSTSDDFMFSNYLLSKTEVRQVNIQWIFSVPVASTIISFGIIGNVLAIVVWKRLRHVLRTRGNKSTAKTLITLSAFNIGVLVLFLTNETIKVAYPSIVKNYSYAAFYAWVGYPGYYTFSAAIMGMIVAITLNRLILIVSPEKGKYWCTERRTNIVIIIVLILALATNIPHLFNYTARDGIGLERTNYGKSNAAIKYHFWVYCVIFVLGAWLIIACSNIVIIRKVSGHAKRFITSSDNLKNLRKKQEHQMTFTLITITVAFLILQGFQCISRCFYLQGYGIVDGKETHSRYIVMSTYAVAKLGLIIHASINCLLYCLTGSMFKKELLKLSRQFTLSSRSCRPSSLTLYSDQDSHTNRTTIANKNADSEH